MLSGRRFAFRNSANASPFWSEAQSTPTSLTGNHLAERGSFLHETACNFGNFLAGPSRSPQTKTEKKIT